MKDRIILLVKALNYTAAQFADEIGVQKSGISHILSGRNNPSLDFIQKILQRFPEVSIEWLMFGKGPVFKERDNVHESIENKIVKTQIEVNRVHDDLFSLIDDEKESENSILRGLNFNQETSEHQTSVDNPIEPKLQEAVSNIIGKNELPISHSSPTQKQEGLNEKKIERIVFFYTDKSFTEYKKE